MPIWSLAMLGMQTLKVRKATVVVAIETSARAPRVIHGALRYFSFQSALKIKRRGGVGFASDATEGVDVSASHAGEEVKDASSGKTAIVTGSNSAPRSGHAKELFHRSS